MPNIVKVGNRELVMADEKCALIARWRAVWTYHKEPHRWDPSLPIYLPDPPRLVIALNPIAALAKPGTMPMMILEFQLITAYKKRIGTSKVNAAPYFAVAVSYDNGDAFMLDDCPAEGRLIDGKPCHGDNLLSAMGYLCSNNTSILLSKCPKFTLPDLIGQSEFDKVAKNGRARFRKFMREA